MMLVGQMGAGVVNATTLDGKTPLSLDLTFRENPTLKCDSDGSDAVCGPLGELLRKMVRCKVVWKGANTLNVQDKEGTQHRAGAGSDHTWDGRRHHALRTALPAPCFRNCSILERDGGGGKSEGPALHRFLPQHTQLPRRCPSQLLRRVLWAQCLCKAPLLNTLTWQ